MIFYFSKRMPRQATSFFLPAIPEPHPASHQVTMRNTKNVGAANSETCLTSAGLPVFLAGSSKR